MEDNNREWMYDAFISYRHLEPDAFVAGSLHKILESYKLPGNLVKANGDKLKRTKIKKVFRDAEELPLTSNLNDTIMTALENSEYLIAICSPRFGESLWCKKEVDTFIKLRGADHVLTVLVDGEPSESFPEALLYKDVEKVMDDGSIEIILEPMEPLAANARGANNRERLKLLKTESLRLMAPMFGCSFDDLKQRHREQKMKRTMQIIGGVAAVCLCFGIISTSMALQISRQNSQIMKQNDMIMDQNNQITLQAKTIQEQYAEAVISNANAVADYARNIYEDGDRVEAIERAYSVYSMDSYVPKVEYVLSDALNLYANGRNLKPDRILKCDALVEHIAFSPSYEYIAVRTNDEVVSIWNTANGVKYNSFVLDSWSTPKDSFVFKNDNELFMVNGGKIELYNISDQLSKEFATEVDNDCKLSYSSDKDILLVVDGNGAKIFDASTGTLISSVSDKERCFDSSIISAGKDEYFATAFGGYDHSDIVVKVCSTVDGSIIDTLHFTDISTVNMKFYGDDFYLIVNSIGGDGAMFDSNNYLSDVYRYVIEDDGLKLKWRKNYSGTFGNDVVITHNGESDTVAIQFYSQVDVVSRANAENINQYALESGIVKLYGYKDSEFYSVALRDGSWIAIDSTREDIIDTGFFESVSSNIEHHLAGSCTATVEYSSNDVVLYRYAISEDAVETEEQDFKPEPASFDVEIREKLDTAGVNTSFVKGICYENTGRYIGVVYMNHTMDVFSFDEDQNINDLCAHFSNCDIYVNYMEFSPDNELLVMSDGYEAFLLRTDENQLDNNFPGEENIVAHINNFGGIDFDKQIVYVKDYDTYYKVPLYSKEKIGEIAKRLIDETK